MVDLRSDTVTLPTPEMRQAMAQAEVGDDVYGEDPSINRLEALAAERLGKAAGMFVPSGTMGNLSALLTHCGRGDEVILGDQSHTFLLEAGGLAALGGIHPRPVPNQPDGTLKVDDIEAAVRRDDPHFPRTRLIALENTHNRCGGAVLRPQYMAAVREVADRHGLAVHLDGARIFNAAVALGMPTAELARDVDSVTFCLSKGLSAPVGSVLCGSEDFIRRARRARKVLGGGMRQAGVLAAAGIVALDKMVDRLAEDHANAKRLAAGLAEMPGIDIDPATVETDIVIFALLRDDITPQELSDRLREQGILLLPTEGRRLRAVTHYGIDTAAIDQALAAFRRILD
jgi:threonine aldolase